MNKLLKRILHLFVKYFGPDKLYLKLWFHSCMGYWMDFKHPRTFNEKLQWLKLHDRKPIYTTLVDKYAVKKYVADIIGEQYIIPTLGVWNSFDDINFDQLPNRFVLKCTHDSGSVVICKDKETFDKDRARQILVSGLKTNYYKKTREWPYKNVKPRIIAEEFKQDIKSNDLPDYKFFCFDGVVKAMYIATERQNNNTDTRFDFFDRDFNHLEFTNGHPMADSTPEKPDCYDEMIELAEMLSKGIPHVRVDFFEENGKVLFGEMTFFHMGGTTPFEPFKWDEVFGSWIKLP